MPRILLLISLAAALLSGCGRREEAAARAKSVFNSQTAAIEARYPKAIATASGLRYVIIEPGSGEATPQRGDTVTAHYSLRLLGEDEVIDSSRRRAQPFSFQIGSGQVIPAWDEAFLDMKKGERRTLLAPSHLAYGPRGAGSAIPPDAVLVFDVELLDFE